MKTVTVDTQHRIRIGGEPPETKFWLLPQSNGYLLQRIPIPEPRKKPTKVEIVAMLRRKRMKFDLPRAEMMKMTREVD